MAKSLNVLLFPLIPVKLLNFAEKSSMAENQAMCV